ncbi:unnamed protein product [Rodentolepis nana]|uniref:COesterase domain-containing protein n=1 Tax=Rodentolepis nana TaxID=102285 RepID=A0A0R3TY85_RODNA|nr:unnamed protein product [Rodentolepis nana]
MRLRSIFARLFLLSCLLFGLVSPGVDEWIWELSFPVRSIAGVFETSPAGLRYNRGFPRGIWGTNLAPDLGRYDETNQSFLTDGELRILST